MKRRSLFKAAIGISAGAAMTRFGESVAAAVAPHLVGTGCTSCRPDLFPAGFGTGRSPIDANHYAVEWMRVPDPYIAPVIAPVIALGGVPVKRVTELYVGADGWLIRNHEDRAIPVANKAHLCACGAENVQVELWRGAVTQTGIESLTRDEIARANDESAKRAARFALIEEFANAHPAWADLVWAGHRDFPDKIPLLRREAIQSGIDWDAGYKTYVAGMPYVQWRMMPWPI